MHADVSLSHQAWSIEEGLPQASVHRIFQSRDGYLWLATEGGVARFDGSGFRVFRHENEPSLLSNDISSIAQDTSGALWFGTANGLVRYQNSQWRLFTEQDGLPSSTILSLVAAGDGSILALTQRGLVHSRNVGFEPIAAFDRTIISLQEAPDGSAWLLTANGVWRYQDGAVQPQTSLPRYGKVPMTDGTVQGIQSGPGGVVWSRTLRSVTLVESAFQRNLQTGHDLPGGRVTTLYVDRQGTGWIGTNHGLFFLRPERDAPVQAVDALRLDSILSILEDQEGNIWVGTETSGLHALRPRTFRTESATAGEAVTTGTITPDGVLWFGTQDEGVHKVRGGIAEQSIAAELLTSAIVLSVAHGAKGEVWVGTPDGLNRVAGKSVQKFTSSNGLPDDYVRSVLVDTRGTVWAGTRRGLARIEGNRIQTLTQSGGLGSDSIGPLVESLPQTVNRPSASFSDLWVGTAAGLSHVRGSRIENFSPYADQSKNAVTAIAQENDETLWLGLHGQGLSRFADGRFTPISNAALPSEIVSIVVDGQGYLWLRGVRGVFRVALAAVRTCADQKTACDLTVAEYGVADGMPSDAAAAQGLPSMWRGNNGELWFATRKGVAAADPAHLPFNRLQPPVVIQRFLVDETEVPPSSDVTKIDAGHTRYTFDYAALSYTLPSKNRYRYTLEGLDKAWIDAGTQRTVSYTSLPARSYRFHVQAQNNDGVWNEAGAEFRFRILPPVYRRWWFYCLIAVAIAALTMTIFRLREQYVQRRFDLVLNERNRIAREVHDTLAQDLVSVSLQLDLTKRLMQANHVEQATSQLEATRRLVKEGLEAARQSIWNLRANASEDSLPARLTLLVGKYTDSENPPRLKIGGAFRKLAPSIEGEFLRVAQESLSNTYRHTSATEIFVTLHYDPSALSLSIRDNGQGFSPEAVKKMEGHYGLRGMEERAASLHANLTIESSAGEGTTVHLLLPLAEKEDKAS